MTAKRITYQLTPMPGHTIPINLSCVAYIVEAVNEDGARNQAQVTARAAGDVGASRWLDERMTACVCLDDEAQLPMMTPEELEYLSQQKLTGWGRMLLQEARRARFMEGYYSELYREIMSEK